jgi:hypothetical protein
VFQRRNGIFHPYTINGAGGAPAWSSVAGSCSCDSDGLQGGKHPPRDQLIPAEWAGHDGIEKQLVICFAKSRMLREDLQSEVVE